MAYSTITLQQMNLVHKYPSIYWKTACLSVNAGALNEEDFYNLVEEGVIELSDEEDVRSSKKIQYGKVASAIGDMRGSIEVLQPDINLSRMGFTPDAENNVIRYGLKGITRVGDNIIQEIILNRPYTSLENFAEKMTTTDDKKLISKDKVVNLIKAGAFDLLEKKPREEILKNYINIIAETKNRLNLQNFMMLMRKNLVPDSLEEEKKCYNFTKYIRKQRYNNYYIIDEVAIEYLLERFPPERIVKISKDGEEVNAISEVWWDGIYTQLMNNVRTWIREKHDFLLSELNDTIFSEEFEKYARGNILDWELQSLNFFYSGHPLDRVEFPLEIESYNDIREGEIVGHFLIKGKNIPKMKLHTIAGTVIDKDKTKSVVTLATRDAVVDVKLYKQQFAKFAHESNLDEDDENYKPNEENFLEKGTHLVLTGIKRGDMFIPKVYKNTGIHSILKAIIQDGKFIEFKAKADA
jgi:DNA polymerase-3 subunit alpha